MDPPVDTNVNALVSCVSLFTHVIATFEYMGGIVLCSFLVHSGFKGWAA